MTLPQSTERQSTERQSASAWTTGGPGPVGAAAVAAPFDPADDVSPYWRHAPWAGPGQPWRYDGTDLTAPQADAPRPGLLERLSRFAGLLVTIGSLASLLLASRAGSAYGRAAVWRGAMGPGVVFSSVSHAWAWTLGWSLAALVGAVGWVLAVRLVVRRSPAAHPGPIVGGIIAAVLSLGACLAVLLPTLDNLPG